MEPVAEITRRESQFYGKRVLGNQRESICCPATARSAHTLRTALQELGRFEGAHNRQHKKVFVTRQKYIEQQKEVESAFASFVKVRGVTFIYIEDILCDERVCPMGNFTHPYFTDSTHLTKTAALLIKDKLKNDMSF